MNMKLMRKKNKFRRGKRFSVRLKNADKLDQQFLSPRGKIGTISLFVKSVFAILYRLFMISAYSFLVFVVTVAVEDVFGAVLIKNTFGIQLIEVQNNVIVDDEKILKACRIKPDENILTLNLSHIKEKIEGLDNIKSAVVSRILPGQLTIKVEETVPVVRMIIGGELIDIDGKEVKMKNGYFLFKHLPVLKGINLTPFGEISSKDMEKYSKLINVNNIMKTVLKRKSDEIIKIESAGDWLDFNVKSGITIRFPLNYEELLLDKLVVVLNDCYGKKTLPKLIDLRYNNNVFVKY